MVLVGEIGDGVPAYVNRHYVAAELKILTGFIEPHMWAGYSGGRKSILPGISSLRTLQYMHGPEMVAHPETRYGVLDGNPFHEAALTVMARPAPTSSSTSPSIPPSGSPASSPATPWRRTCRGSPFSPATA
jgi:nickel-dependent lactate racemase